MKSAVLRLAHRDYRHARRHRDATFSHSLRAAWAAMRPPELYAPDPTKLSPEDAATFAEAGRQLQALLDAAGRQ